MWLPKGKVTMHFKEYTKHAFKNKEYLGIFTNERHSIYLTFW